MSAGADPRPPTAPPPGGARPVLAVVSDLFFRAKIDEVARRLDLPLRVARSPEQLERHLTAAAPALALVDLEAVGIDPVAAIGRLKGASVPVVGFVGHTNVAAIEAARRAGAVEVVARSAFQARLPVILTRVAEAERAGRGAAESAARPDGAG